MIRYALRCAEGHAFESWFQSAAAYDTLASAGRLSCAACGSAEVTKAMMAPKVGGAIDAGAPTPPAAPRERPLSEPRGKLERAMADLRRKVEANATDVGRNFAREARAIHAGETPDRAIYGEATPSEARSLVEDGVPIAPLPFVSKSKTN